MPQHAAVRALDVLSQRVPVRGAHLLRIEDPVELAVVDAAAAVGVERREQHVGVALRQPADDASDLGEFLPIEESIAVVVELLEDRSDVYPVELELCAQLLDRRGGCAAAPSPGLGHIRRRASRAARKQKDENEMTENFSYFKSST